MVIRPFRAPASIVALAVASLMPPIVGQTSTHPRGEVPGGMEWIDLRTGGAPVQALRRLWADRLDASTRRWLASDPKGRPLPAYTLVRAFPAAQPQVLVSILFTLHDCELPGNGAGADLYARCPMRVLLTSNRTARVITVERACHLYVPPVAHPGDGPSADRNRTTVELDADRTLQLRVTQHGRPVPACNLDVPLG